MDIYTNFNAEEYKAEVLSVTRDDLIVSMCDLQYNLSNSLDKKYICHKRAVWCLKKTLILMLISSLILIIA